MIKNCNERIIKQTILLGAKKGVGRSLSTKEVANLSKINEATIFSHFKTKANLMQSALLTIDEEIAAVLAAHAIDPSDFQGSVRKIWDAYMDYLIQTPDKAQYYYAYFNSICYTDDVRAEQKKVYAAFLNSLIASVQNSDLYQKFDGALLWTAIINSSLSFALKITRGNIEDNEGNRNFIFDVTFDYIFRNIAFKAE